MMTVSGREDMVSFDEYVKFVEFVKMIRTVTHTMNMYYGAGSSPSRRYLDDLSHVLLCRL